MLIPDKFTSARFLMALAFTGTFCALALFGLIPSDAVKDVVLVVISFYFGQSGNRNQTQ